MIKCLLFDCDGTLVDSEFLCNLALEIKLRAYGVDTSANTLMEKYRGGKLANTLQSIEQEHDISLKENFEVSYRAFVEQLFKKELTACKGVPEFLSQNILSVGVASNAPTKKINTALEITDLKKYFHTNIFSAYDINSWKPDPELFLYAAKKMGVLPSECLVIEDSIKGVNAGLAAHMKTILFDPANIHQNIAGVSKIDNMYQLKHILTAHNSRKNN